MILLGEGARRTRNLKGDDPPSEIRRVVTAAQAGSGVLPDAGTMPGLPLRCPDSGRHEGDTGPPEHQPPTGTQSSLGIFILRARRHLHTAVNRLRSRQLMAAYGWASLWGVVCVEVRCPLPLRPVADISRATRCREHAVLPQLCVDTGHAIPPFGSGVDLLDFRAQGVVLSTSGAHRPSSSGCVPASGHVQHLAGGRPTRVPFRPRT